MDFIKQRRLDLETWLYSLTEQHLMHAGAKDVQFNDHYRQFLTDGANYPPQPLVKVFPEHIENQMQVRYIHCHCHCHCHRHHHRHCHRHHHRYHR